MSKPIRKPRTKPRRPRIQTLSDKPYDVRLIAEVNGRMANLKKHHGVQQKHVAYALRINRASLSLWLSGTDMPSIYAFGQLYDLLFPHQEFKPSATSATIADHINKLILERNREDKEKAAVAAEAAARAALLDTAGASDVYELQDVPD